MRPFVSVTGLRKSYGAHRVLDGIDLTIPQGTVFSLLGPNGAGKTTTMQILSTLIKADAGEVRVAGHDLAKEPDKVRAAIGVTGQFSAVDSFLLPGVDEVTIGRVLNKASIEMAIRLKGGATAGEIAGALTMAAIDLVAPARAEDRPEGEIRAGELLRDALLGCAVDPTPTPDLLELSELMEGARFLAPVQAAALRGTTTSDPGIGAGAGRPVGSA